MAWFLIAATLVIVVAIAAAVIAWANVVRDGIRLLETLAEASRGRSGSEKARKLLDDEDLEPGHRLP